MADEICRAIDNLCIDIEEVCRLTDKQARAFFLREKLGRTFQEIADEMKLSSAKAAQRLVQQAKAEIDSLESFVSQCRGDKNLVQEYLLRPAM